MVLCHWNHTASLTNSYFSFTTFHVLLLPIYSTSLSPFICPSTPFTQPSFIHLPYLELSIPLRSRHLVPFYFSFLYLYYPPLFTFLTLSIPRRLKKIPRSASKWKLVEETGFGVLFAGLYKNRNPFREKLRFPE